MIKDSQHSKAGKVDFCEKKSKLFTYPVGFVIDRHSRRQIFRHRCAQLIDDNVRTQHLSMYGCNVRIGHA